MKNPNASSKKRKYRVDVVIKGITIAANVLYNYLLIMKYVMICHGIRYLVFKSLLLTTTCSRNPPPSTIFSNSRQNVPSICLIFSLFSFSS